MEDRAIIPADELMAERCVPKEAPASVEVISCLQDANFASRNICITDKAVSSANSIGRRAAASSTSTAICIICLEIHAIRKEGGVGLSREGLNEVVVLLRLREVNS